MPLTATGELSVACRLGREPAHAARAREQARQALCGWGLGQHTDLAELVVSELVTNALCHGAGLIEMRLSYADGDLRVEIHDSGVGRPVRQHVDADDECGRGLELLDGLIELHGGERGVIDDDAGPGKTVYVELSLPSAPEASGDPVPSAAPAGCSPAAPSSSLLPLRTARHCGRSPNRVGGGVAGRCRAVGDRVGVPVQPGQHAHRAGHLGSEPAYAGRGAHSPKADPLALRP
jgi:hypothetical protein